MNEKHNVTEALDYSKAATKLNTAGQEAAAAATIIRRARDFVRSQNIEVGVLPFGKDVIHNTPPYNPQQNWAEYEFAFDSVADYELYVEYAAETERPCNIYWDGNLISSAQMNSKTGGWGEASQRWERQGVVSGVVGIHTLRIFRSDVFPHIRTIKLVRITG